MNSFPSPASIVTYEITGKSEQLGDAWTLAAGGAQALWYIQQWTRHGYTDITVNVWAGQ